MSFSEWREVKLEDIIEIEMGQSPKSEFYNQTGEGLPFLQGNRTFGDKYPYFDTYCTENKKIANKNDVIMSVRAPVGDLNIAQTQISLGRGVCAMRLKGEQNSNYLFYLMKHNIKEMINRESGTVFGSVNKKDILGLDVKITNNKLEQKAIAHILSTLDDKIEVNNQINKTLENMAQAIFKQWFVDFEFPNEDGEPYKSSGGEMVESELGMIPKGWVVKELGDVVEFQNGYAFKSKDLLDKEQGDCYRVFKMGHIIKGGGLNKEGTKSFVPKKDCLTLARYLIKKGDLLMCMTDMKSNVALLGHTALMDEDDKYILNQRVGLLRTIDPSIINYPYLYILSNSKDFIENLRSRANSGVQVNLSTKEIKETLIIVPSKHIHKKYNDITEKVFAKSFNIAKENEVLKNARDTLLPKLMSGEIRVPFDEEGEVS